jgi:hypothetical protein
MAGKSNQGFFEPCWTPVSGPYYIRRPHEEVYEKLERYEAALKEIRDQDWVENCLDPQWAARIAQEALDA